MREIAQKLRIQPDTCIKTLLGKDCFFMFCVLLNIRSPTI